MWEKSETVYLKLKTAVQDQKWAGVMSATHMIDYKNHLFGSIDFRSAVY